MAERAVIVGGGHAAGQCAASLRQKGWTGDIVIVGEEPYAPYQRPPLSKAYLAGDLDAERLYVKPTAFYEKENVELRLGVRAEAIDRAARDVALSDGERLGYDVLVLATGAAVRRLPVPGADLSGVGYVRTIADVDRLRGAFEKARNLVVVGAGYIGLEVAAVARKRGLEVDVVERADRVMARVAGPTVSAFFEKLHRDNGVRLRLGAGFERFEGDGAGRVREARIAGVGAIPCDVAVVGVGIVPNDRIAADAGLAVDDGVLVDDCARTEDPRIYAIGDATRHPSRYFGGRLRLESVHNAIEQAKTAAAAICGAPKPYDQAPWFWSDQYDVKLQTVGVCAGREEREIVRGAPEDKSFSVFYLKDERLLAVDSVNAPADHMLSRRLIAAGAPINAAALADPSVDLKSLA
ncbi:MAG: NAD(P)/FAD-dependent oxidoreductase [Parvularculaceae bacterium]